MHTLSSYEDYEETSRHYDGTRRAIGVPIILGCLAETGISLGEMTVLDAGCGTGNYSEALLRHVGRIESVDRSPGMIAQAAAKLAKPLAAGRIQFHEASIDELPLEDQSADGVTINQVLHHLPDDRNDGWPHHRRVMTEMFRVLRPGGVILINTCSQDQLRRGYWYYDLIPKAARAISVLYIPLPALEEMLQQVGFHAVERMVPLDAVLQAESLLNARGPLRKEWRDGDSGWGLASPEELRLTIERVQQMERAGELEAYLQRLDEPRAIIGQTTFMVARRPQAAAAQGDPR
jgi:ubiquinone/menaquinone biosynthesis C-methylase UbiE